MRVSTRCARTVPTIAAPVAGSVGVRHADNRISETIRLVLERMVQLSDGKLGLNDRPEEFPRRSRSARRRRHDFALRAPSRAGVQAPPYRSRL
jgi:hypothetical protein